MSDRPAGLLLGFLTVQQDVAGFSGGYLVTNSWGRPLEFRFTTPVQPNRVQQILYGSTLNDYLYADLIGKTLIEKTGTLPGLIVTDTPDMLPLGSRVNLPVVAVLKAGEGGFTHPRSKLTLVANADQQNEILKLLDSLDTALDLAEPFGRLKDALGEARASGLARAA